MSGELGPEGGAGLGGGGRSHLVSNPKRGAGDGGASFERFQMFPGRVYNFLLSSPSRPLGLPATRLA